MIEMDNSDITLRLTDYNNYPHRHRSRFDNNGDHSKLFIAMVSFIKHMVLTLICVNIIFNLVRDLSSRQGFIQTNNSDLQETV